MTSANRTAYSIVALLVCAAIVLVVSLSAIRIFFLPHPAVAVAQDSVDLATYVEAHEDATGQSVSIQGEVAPAPRTKSVARATPARAHPASTGVGAQEKAAYDKAAFNARKVACLSLAADLKIASDVHFGEITDAGNLVTDYDFCDSPQGLEKVKELKSLFETKGIVLQ